MSAMAVSRYSRGTQTQPCRSKSSFFKRNQTCVVTSRGLVCFTMNTRGFALKASPLSWNLEKSGSVTARRCLVREVGQFVHEANEDCACAPDESLARHVLGDGVLPRKEGELLESGRFLVGDQCCKFRAEAPITRHIERYAFFASLVFSATLGCSIFNGDAEAAVSHLKNASGPVVVDMRDLALGPEGPLVEEFWENVRRYVLYFLTVVTGGIYALLKPVVDSLKNPITAILIIVIISGSIYLIALTVRAMLGVSGFQYDYSI